MHRLIAILVVLTFVRVAVPDEAAGQAVPAPVPAYRQATHVAVLTIEGEIDQVTLRSLERRVARAVREGADAIVLDIDTPGGRLDATLDICHLIKEEAPANTVAWVHPYAFSAGTIISLACREIVVERNAKFGDAAPIQATPMGVVGLGATERAKAESPILAEVVDSARRNHYDENLVTAFISLGVELWLLENVHTGERVFVDRAEYKTVFGEEPPTELTPVAPTTLQQGPAVQPRFNTLIPAAKDPDAASIDPEDLRRQVEYAQSLPPSRQPLTAADRDAWRPVMQVISDDRLLTVNASEGQFYGLATAVINNDQQLQEWFGAQTVRRYDRSWSEALVRFLTHPVVMGVLIVVFIICLISEMAAPGFGVFGAGAVIALLLLLGAPYLAGMAQWWDILLIVVGLLLVAVELFLIPGVGVVGFAGAVALLAGLVGTFVSGDIGTPQGQTELVTGLLTTLTSLIAAGVGVWLISRQMHTIPVLQRLILSTEVGDREPATMLTAMAAGRRADPVVGDEGIAITDLRPAGRVEFGGKLYDVKSTVSFIEKGSRVRIVAADGFVIEVEEAGP